ncbi:MAG: hypothetical protein M1815_000739 [Lichina confinis]|nr:MAG: hypothetical protein M1815_000739 [Lichina confinis]
MESRRRIISQLGGRQREPCKKAVWDDAWPWAGPSVLPDDSKDNLGGDDTPSIDRSGSSKRTPLAAKYDENGPCAVLDRIYPVDLPLPATGDALPPPRISWGRGAGPSVAMDAADLFDQALASVRANLTGATSAAVPRRRAMALFTFETGGDASEKGLQMIWVDGVHARAFAFKYLSDGQDGSASIKSPVVHESVPSARKIPPAALDIARAVSACTRSHDADLLRALCHLAEYPDRDRVCRLLRPPAAAAVGATAPSEEHPAKGSLTRRWSASCEAGWGPRREG